MVIIGGGITGVCARCTVDVGHLSGWERRALLPTPGGRRNMELSRVRNWVSRLVKETMAMLEKRRIDESQSEFERRGGADDGEKVSM